MADYGWDYPPGVTESMIPGNGPDDGALGDLLEGVPTTCPGCKQATAGNGEYDFADHITVAIDCCVVEVWCGWQSDKEDADPCEVEFVSTRSGPMCRECDPPEREY